MVLLGIVVGCAGLISGKNPGKLGTQGTKLMNFLLATFPSHEKGRFRRFCNTVLDETLFTALIKWSFR